MRYNEIEVPELELVFVMFMCKRVVNTCQVYMLVSKKRANYKKW